MPKLSSARGGPDREDGRSSTGRPQIDPSAPVRVGESATRFPEKNHGRRVIPLEATFGDHGVDPALDQLEDRGVGVHPGRKRRDPPFATAIPGPCSR